MDIFIFVIYFHEDQDTIQQGATRTFRDRMIMLETCKNAIFSFRKYPTEIHFALIGFHKDNRFYHSPWAMQNYVKYITLLSNWANNQPNVVIYLGHLLDGIELVDRDTEMPVIGWYSFDSTNNVYITKRDEALQVSMLHYKVDSPLNNNNETIFIIIGVLLILFVFTILASIFVIRRFYRNKNLPKHDIETFFNGDNTNSDELFRTKYNKEKYEISSEKFAIDESQLLGSGEFANVFRGTVNFASGELRVAV